MAEQQGQFQTRTTVLSQTQVQPEIRYDPSYFQTVPGLIKIILIIANLIGFICIQISLYSARSEAEFFTSIALIGFFFTGIFFILYLFHVLEKFYKLPWLLIELIFGALWTIMNLVAASVVISLAWADSWYTAAACFGYLCMIGYGVDTFFHYRTYRSGGIAQGTRTVQQQQQVTSIFNLIGFLCIQISHFSYHSRGEFFSSIAMIGFWFTGILLVLYVFHVLEKFYAVPWLKVELIFNAIWTIMYLIAATLAVTFGSNWFTAAGFFGYCCMIAYGYDAFTKYQIHRAGGIAQGTRTVTQQQHITAVTVQQ